MRGHTFVAKKTIVKPKNKRSKEESPASYGSVKLMYNFLAPQQTPEWRKDNPPPKANDIKKQSTDGKRPTARGRKENFQNPLQLAMTKDEYDALIKDGYVVIDKPGRNFAQINDAAMRSTMHPADANVQKQKPAEERKEEQGNGEGEKVPEDIMQIEDEVLDLEPPETEEKVLHLASSSTADSGNHGDTAVRITPSCNESMQNDSGSDIPAEKNIEGSVGPSVSVEKTIEKTIEKKIEEKIEKEIVAKEKNDETTPVVQKERPNKVFSQENGSRSSSQEGQKQEVLDGFFNQYKCTFCGTDLGNSGFGKYCFKDFCLKQLFPGLQ